MNPAKHFALVVCGFLICTVLYLADQMYYCSRWLESWGERQLHRVERALRK